VNVTIVLELVKRRLQWFVQICKKEEEDDIRRVHEIRVKVSDTLSIDRRRQSRKISNPVPSMKRTLSTVRWRCLIELGL